MSLKAFHVFFIILSTLTTAGFGAWGIGSYVYGGETIHLILALFSLLFTGVLIWYFKWFLRKLKNVGYL